MGKTKPILTQTQLTSVLRGLARAGYEPHRAVIKRDSVTLIINPDLPDDPFADDEPVTPESAFDKWKAKRDAR